jgi:3D (Asp-Asp-Asp) domain-containing protein
MKILLTLCSVALMAAPGHALEVTATSYSYREADHQAYGCRNCTGGVLDDTQIAADTRYYPLGTKIWIQGLGNRTVTDRGSDVIGPKHIDIHFVSLVDMRAWGTRTVEIKVLSRGDEPKVVAKSKPEDTHKTITADPVLRPRTTRQV